MSLIKIASVHGTGITYLSLFPSLLLSIVENENQFEIMSHFFSPISKNELFCENDIAN